MYSSLSNFPQPPLAVLFKKLIVKRERFCLFDEILNNLFRIILLSSNGTLFLYSFFSSGYFFYVCNQSLLILPFATITSPSLTPSFPPRRQKEPGPHVPFSSLFQGKSWLLPLLFFSQSRFLSVEISVDMGSGHLVLSNWTTFFLLSELGIPSSVSSWHLPFLPPWGLLFKGWYLSFIRETRKAFPWNMSHSPCPPLPGSGKRDRNWVNRVFVLINWF